MGAELEFHDDPAAFLEVAGALLAADPVEATVLVTVSARMSRERATGVPEPDGFPLWWVVERDGDRVVGAGMRTAPFPPHPVYLMRMSDEGARRL
ncbi:MAG: hypothetical protein ACTHOK_15460, partial [Nocardioidaceae bacterium]